MSMAALTTWRASWVQGALDKVGPLGRLAFHIALGGLIPFAVGAFPFEDVFAAFARHGLTLFRFSA